MSAFRVAVSAAFRRRDGTWNFPGFDIGALEADGAFEVVHLRNDPVLAPSDLDRFDGLILAGESLPAATLAAVASTLAIVARFGVGYDKVDVAACTDAGVALTIAPDAVRRPVAVAALTLVLALAGRLLVKDRLTREGATGFARRTDHMGVGLEGRTLASIGLGNIAAEMFRLAAPFGMRHIAHDPWARPEVARETRCEMTSLDAVFREADFLCVHCPLTPATRGLVNAERIATMKPAAFLVNTARGPIVDETALVDALTRGTIAGAGLDVLEREPPPEHAPILALPNVILAPHALSWTDQCFAAIGTSCMASMRAVARGTAPSNVVDDAVLSSASFERKLERWRR